MIYQPRVVFFVFIFLRLCCKVFIYATVVRHTIYPLNYATLGHVYLEYSVAEYLNIFLLHTKILGKNYNFRLAHEYLKFIEKIFGWG